MNKQLLNLSCLALFGAMVAHAQVGVGTTTPRAALEIHATDGGILIPRVQLTSPTVAAPVSNPQGGALLEGTLVYNLGAVAPGHLAAGFYYWNGSQWTAVGGAASTPHNTLDQAYNQGGAGAGRTITANAGSVQIINQNSGGPGLQVNNAMPNTAGISVAMTASGVGVMSTITAANSDYSAIQGVTNSSKNTTSAVVGISSGGATGVTGEALASASAQQAMLGNHMKTTAGNGVSGMGFNGLYGTTNNPYDGYGLYTPHDIFLGAGVYGPSDARYKSNLKPFTHALQELKGLSVNTYRLRYEVKDLDAHGKPRVHLNDREEIGLLAQEVETVFPHMIKETSLDLTQEGGDTLKAVNYTQMIPVLVRAVQELNDELTQLRAEVQALRAAQDNR